MGPWRRFKAWAKRTAVRIFLKFARTRFVRFVQSTVAASPVPLAITGGGALVGTGVAAAAALPLAYGALIGAGIAVAGMVATKLYLMNVEETTRNNKWRKLHYTIWKRKEKDSEGRTYVVESSAMGIGAY